jgi:hypothetical protein
MKCWELPLIIEDNAQDEKNGVARLLDPFEGPGGPQYAPLGFLERGLRAAPRYNFPFFSIITRRLSDR